MTSVWQFCIKTWFIHVLLITRICLFPEFGGCGHVASGSKIEDVAEKGCGPHAHYCGNWFWLIYPWSECKENSSLSVEIVDPFLSSEGDNGFGFSTRKIECVNKDLEKKNEKLCHRLTAPPTVKVCDFAKPQDCTLSEPGPWTECGSCLNPFRIRVRQVLVPPSNGGKECPSVVEKEDCAASTCNDDHGLLPKNVSFLKIGKWSTCAPTLPTSSPKVVFQKLSPKMPRYFFYSFFLNDEKKKSVKDLIVNPFRAEIGTQSREITCMKQNSKWCHDYDTVKRETELTRSCIVDKDCFQVSETGWSMTEKGCIGFDKSLWPDIWVKEKITIQPPSGYGKLCEPPTRVITNYNNLLPCKELLYLNTSPWGPCEYYNDEVAVTVKCGRGIRKRSIVCLSFTNNTKPISLDYCARLGPMDLSTTEHCVGEPCRENCVVGPWGPWTQCFRTVDQSSASNKGVKIRNRTIITEASAEGNQCPHLEEVKICYLFTKRLLDITECYLNGKLCGDGIKQQRYFCFNENGVKVDDQNCKMYNIEKTTTGCNVPCDSDCILQDWSEWSTCSSPCYNGHEKPFRTRERLSQAVKKPTNCTKIVEKEDCNMFLCRSYHWLQTNWTECKKFHKVRHAKSKRHGHFWEKPNNNSLMEAVDHSSSGFATSQLICVDDEEVQAATSMCDGLKKLEIYKDCRIEENNGSCLWSMWLANSDCPSECIPFAQLQSRIIQLPTIVQTRHVISQPRGLICKQATEPVVCLLTHILCENPIWVAKNWSNCVLAAELSCGSGHKTRTIWCAEGDPHNIAPFCNCYNDYQFYPQVDRICEVSCKETITTSEPECQCSKHSENRFYDAERQHSIDPSSGKCVCETYKVIIEDTWSQCIVTNQTILLRNGFYGENLCGGGTRYRRHMCFDPRGRLTDPSFCGMTGSGVESEDCQVPCPLDCVLTDWSDWSSCSEACATGNRTRERLIVRSASFQGRPCGHTREWASFENDCAMYQWSSGHWSGCQLLRSQSDCGAGFQERHNWCVETFEQFPSKRVNDSLCCGLERPTDKRECTLPCPGECAYTRWSPWNSCSKANAMRVRYRNVLRPTTILGQTCDQLIETELCVFNKNSFTYRWKLSSFSNCIPIEQNQDCGIGFKTRIASCERSDGKKVENIYCAKIPETSSKKVQCETPCPVDCETSAWSEWDESSCSPGSANGDQFRRRVVEIEPTVNGRPCPVLEETMPCPVVAKYNWQKSAWGPCQLEKGFTCGYGKKTRQIECMRESQRVRFDYCMGTDQVIQKGESKNLIDDDLNIIDRRIRDMETEVSCFVRCPRDSDCMMTDWSQWSPCYTDIPFQKNIAAVTFNVFGVQSRSRGIITEARSGSKACPKNLLETRPCLVTVVVRFTWWYNQDGTVICQRSDGLIVSVGCDEEQRPCPIVCSGDYWMCTPGPCVCSKALFPSATHCRETVTLPIEVETEPTETKNDEESLSAAVKPNILSNVIIFFGFSLLTI